MHKKGFAMMEVPGMIIAAVLFLFVSAVVLGFLIFAPGRSVVFTADVGSSENDAMLNALLMHKHEGNDIASLIARTVENRFDSESKDLGVLKKALDEYFGDYSQLWRMKISVRQEAEKPYYVDEYSLSKDQALRSSYDIFFNDFKSNYPESAEPAYLFLPKGIRVEFAAIEQHAAGGTS